MVTWANRQANTVYPAWWQNRERRLARQLREMNYAQLLSDENGLPDGMTIKKAAMAFFVWVEGTEVHRQQFISQIEVQAKNLAAWVEAYRAEVENLMGVSDKAIEFLKVLREGAITEKAAGAYQGMMRAALVKKDMIAVKNGMVSITATGLDVLRGLPEFDTATSPPTPLLEERGEKNVPNRDEERGESVFSEGFMPRAVVVDPVAAAIDQLARETAEIVQGFGDDAPLVKVVVADGYAGGDLVHVSCGELSNGQMVVYLRIEEALVRAIYPQIVALQETLALNGLETLISAKMQILLTADPDEIPF